MTRFVEALASAAVVAVLMGLLCHRVGADLVIGPAGAALVTFLAVMLRRSSARVRSRRATARRRARKPARTGGRNDHSMEESTDGE